MPHRQVKHLSFAVQATRGGGKQNTKKVDYIAFTYTHFVLRLPNPSSFHSNICDAGNGTWPPNGYRVLSQAVCLMALSAKEVKSRAWLEQGSADCSHRSVFLPLCVPTVLCSHGSMFSYVFVSVAPCSHGSMFP